jgi:hypothetical protein
MGIPRWTFGTPGKPGGEQQAHFGKLFGTRSQEWLFPMGLALAEPVAHDAAHEEFVLGLSQYGQ